MGSAIANIRLSEFFDKYSNTLKKEAGSSNFNDFYSRSDIEGAPMMSEILDLPKYDSIRRRITNTNGVINFVTKGGFAPLWELLLRSALPPEKNDIYDMGCPVITQGDFFVNAVNQFGGPDSGGGERLGEILFGIQAKQDMEWLMDEGIVKIKDGQPEYHVDELAVQYYTRIDPVPIDSNSRAEQAGESLRLKSGEIEPQRVVRIAKALARQHIQIAKAYSEEQEVLYNNPGYNLMIQLSNEIREDAEQKALRRQRGLDINFDGALTKDKIDRKIKKIQSLRRSWLDFRDSIESKTIYQNLNIANNSIEGGIERVGGLSDWEPTGKIQQFLEMYRKLAQVVTYDEDPTPSQRIINNSHLRAFDNLYAEIVSFETNDPNLLLLKRQIRQIMGDSPEARRDNMSREWGKMWSFIALLNRFIERVGEHGQVIILTDVDKSSLVTEDPHTKEVRITDGGFIQDFEDKSDSRAVRSGNQGTGGSGKKIIMVSENPLSGIPASNVISMNTEPVDAQEAEIIVRFLTAGTAKYAKNVALVRHFSLIEEQYNAGVIDEEAKDQENENYTKEFQRIKDSLGAVSDFGKQSLQDVIVGMPHKVAISLVQQSLAMSLEDNRDSRNLLISYDINEREMIKFLTEQANRIAENDSRGITVRSAKVTFKDYIYDKSSDFGIFVGQFEGAAMDIGNFTSRIEEMQKQIGELNIQIASGTTPQRAEELASEKEQLQRTIRNLSSQLHSELKALPHVMILWGPPGSGKSVFADALANLCGFNTIYNVDPSSLTSKWHGETEQFTDVLISTVFGGARRTVFLFDEFERTLSSGSGDESGSGGGGGSQTSTEQISERMISKFLAAFEDKKSKLIENDIFCILTTNKLNLISPALRSRAPGGIHQVKQSDRPEDYERFLEHFLETEKKDTPFEPWIHDINPETGWKMTEDVIRSVDIPAVAAEFCRKKLSFRCMTGAVHDAIRYHVRYQNDVAALADGTRYMKNGIIEDERSGPLRGVPYTTENLLLAASFAVPNQGGNTGTEETSGIVQATSRVLKAINPIIEE